MYNIFGKMIIALTIAFAASANLAAAETLNTDASFIIHEADITSFLEDQTSKWLVPNQILTNTIEIQKPYRTWIHEPLWQGSASLKWSKNSKSNVWHFDGEANDLRFFATSLEVHDTVLMSSGGSTIAVRVDVVCSNVSLTVPGKSKLHGELPANWINGVLTIPMQNFNLQTSGVTPVFTVGNCHGPNGFDQFLNQELRKMFSQPGKVQALFAGELQKFINAEVARVQAAIYKPLQFSFAGINTQFEPKTVASLRTGTWVVDGAVVLKSDKGNGTKTIAKDYGVANLSDARASGLAFSRALIPELLAFASRSESFKHDFSSQDVPAFQDFISNRFAQFFVWMDMWNFPTSSIFDFHLNVTSSPRLTGMENTFPGVNFEFAAPVTMQMDAPSNKGKLPYAQFTSTSPASISVSALAEDGELNFTYTLNDAPMSYEFRKEFFKVRRPSTGIGIDTIVDSGKQALTEKQYSFSLPDSASPFADYRMIFEDLIFGKKTFRLEMALQKK